MMGSVTKTNLAPLASSESLDKMTSNFTIEEPWTKPDWADRPTGEKTVQIYQVLDQMVRTMGEGVRSSQGQVENMRRRLERLEIMLEASEAAGAEMEARAGGEQRPETVGPQVEDQIFLSSSGSSLNSC